MSFLRSAHRIPWYYMDKSSRSLDHHQMMPDHDILWSQIVGWGWNTGIVELTARFGAVGRYGGLRHPG